MSAPTPANASPATLPAPPKLLYAVVMLGACTLAAGIGGAFADRLGADRAMLILVLATIGLGCLPTFVPVLFAGRTRSGASTFGLCVLFASGARLLAVLGLALAFDQTRDLTPRSAYWVGVMTGAGLILIVESILAIRLLAQMEQHKHRQQNSKVATA